MWLRQHVKVNQVLDTLSLVAEAILFVHSGNAVDSYKCTMTVEEISADTNTALIVQISQRIWKNFNIATLPEVWRVQ